MNKNILPKLEGKKLTWVFCEMKSGLVFGICAYDKEKELEFIEKMKWEEAYLIESKYSFDFDNSAIAFIKAWRDAKIFHPPRWPHFSKR